MNCMKQEARGSSESSQCDREPRLPVWTKPELTHYGALRDLTAAGSRFTPESSWPGDPPETDPWYKR